MSKWALVFKPSLRWTNGQKNAVGPAMNVLKMLFAPDGTLFFLTEQDWLGTYKDKTLRFVK